MKAWLVNTNTKQENGNPNGYRIMLRQNKVSAYYDRKEAVDKIESGNLILLYHNQNRIIAVGCAISSISNDFDDIQDIEHSVDVNWLWKANFDNSYEPTNYINRNEVNITMVNNTVVNITEQLDYKELFAQIALRQHYL